MPISSRAPNLPRFAPFDLAVLLTISSSALNLPSARSARQARLRLAFRSSPPASGQLVHYGYFLGATTRRSERAAPALQGLSECANGYTSQGRRGKLAYPSVERCDLPHFLTVGVWLLLAIFPLQRLETLGRMSDYANYLVYALTQLPQEDASTRSIAGLILKNHINYHNDRIAPESFEYVKAAIIPALSYPEDMLRRTATQVVAMMIAILQPQNWPEGLSKLTELLGSANFDEAEVSHRNGKCGCKV